MKYRITLQGKTYEVEVERGEAILLDEYDAAAPLQIIETVPAAPAAVTRDPVPAAAPAAPTGAAVEGTQVNAPLPGTVLSVKVSVGQSVKAGEVLVVIEAMKMENEVVAPADGVVKAIHTAKGAAVATGDTLLVI